MIVSIRHKGLKQYFEEGKGNKLPSAQLPKIRRILGMLDSVTSNDDIRALGNSIHQLKGNLAGFWSIVVSGNYRIIFRFDKGDVFDIDYVDYH